MQLVLCMVYGQGQEITRRERCQDDRRADILYLTDCESAQIFQPTHFSLFCLFSAASALHRQTILICLAVSCGVLLTSLDQ